MLQFQAVAKCTNRTTYVLGEITKEEAELASYDDTTFARQGVYLVAVDNENPKEPGRVLARFASEEAAAHLANFFRVNGFLER